MKLMAVKTTYRVRSTGLYVVFYIALAMFLIICMAELYITIKVSNKFKYKKNSPELEIRPIINATSNTVLIWYDEGDVTTVDKWVKLTDDFLEAYRMHPEPQNTASSCDFKHPPRRGQICSIDMNNFGPCIAPFYGYYSFSPCIFLKLSKIYDWIPEYYHGSDKLPPSMPKNLVKKIKDSTARHEGNHIWVNCEGEHDVDKENIEAINYYPKRGFPSYYFPVRHKNDEFLSPLIAVEIVNPKPGFIIRIECRMWAKNLDYRSGTKERQKTSVRFGIMRDEFDYPAEQ